jgi:SET domain-containing protein
VRRLGGAPIFGAALSSDDSTGSTSAHTRRHPLVKIWVRVDTSRIAGQGLFAEQDMRQGTKIIRYIGEKITHEESDRRLAAGNVYIFGLDERFAIDGSTDKNTARFINHACDPNCQTEQFGNTIWIVAIRDIEAGEELTYNYGYEGNDEPAEPCHCGAKNCCGSILGPQYWDRIKQPAPTSLCS